MERKPLCLSDIRPSGHAHVEKLWYLVLHLVNLRVDVLVDNKVLYHAWIRGGCRNQGVNRALKQIFETVLAGKATLHLEWVLSAANLADQPSREWSDSDVKLAPKFWELVESLAGPHSIDLMASA